MTTCELCKGLGWLFSPVGGKSVRCPNGCPDNWTPGLPPPDTRLASDIRIAGRALRADRHRRVLRIYRCVLGRGGAMNEPWNRCDVCGKFIPLSHFELGRAARRLITPDSDRSREEWETLCFKHATQPVPPEAFV